MKNATGEIVSENSVTANPAPIPKFRPLRVWPAVLLVLLMVIARYAPAYMEGGLSTHWMIAVFGPTLCCLLILIWWLAASRATWKERIFGLLGIIVALAITLLFTHPTMRGPATNYLTLPMGMLLFALGAAALTRGRPAIRTGFAVLMAFAGFSYSILLRNEGMTGEYVMDTHWRWTKTAEANWLANREVQPSVPTATARTLLASMTRDVLTHPDWPGFRGADRSGRSQNSSFATNWSAQPPRQLWKISVGPAWSSFAVAGKYLFTQEQRGPNEIIVCYDADSGRELWNGSVEARLDDPLGGPGPRATPTLADGALFAMGPTGILMRVDPASGAPLWQQDLKTVAARAVPMWGFSASPLVIHSLVIVYGGGAGDKGLLAFEAETGKLKWSAPAGNDSYSSAQLNTIAGEPLVLLSSNEGLICVDPPTGKVRLTYEFKTQAYRALQPTVVGDTVVLYSGMSPGTRAIQIKKSADGQLAAEELWTARNFKPDFTDFVAYQGCLYGIDGGFFACIDLKNGERKWKGGRYGKGQAVLLETSGLLLVSTEDGRVVLLRADPAEHTEIASFKALEGKTWNHPVLAGDKLYVRNAQEAACYQLPLAEAKKLAIIKARPAR